MKSKYVFFTFSVLILFYTSLNINLIKIFNPKKNKTYIDSDLYSDKETLTVNLSQFIDIPWDTFRASVTTRQIFTTTVHGTLLGSGAPDENALIKDYFCKKNLEDLGSICHVTLKKGVKFHNGREANAYDVEFSFARQQLSSPYENFVATLLEYDLIGASEKEIEKNKKNIIVDSINYPSEIIKGIKVHDKYSLSFYLKRKNDFFFQKTSLGYLPIVPIEEFDKEYKGWKKWPIGFGKYKVINVDTANHHYILEKANSSENITKYIRLIFSKKDIGDIKILLSSNRGKSIDDIALVLPDILTTALLVFNYQTKLGRNVKFRKAISLALNRTKIAESAPIKNLLSPEDQLVVNSGWQKEHRAQIPIQHQDLKEAKKLLNEIPSHLWKNKTFYIPTTWISDDPENELAYVKEIKKQLKEIELNVIFEKYDPNYSAFKERDTNVIFFTGLVHDMEDVIGDFSYFRENSYAHKSIPIDPEFNYLFDTATNNFLGNPRANPEPTRDLSKYFKENWIAVPIFFMRMSVSYDKKRVKDIGKQSQNNKFSIYLWRIKLNK